MPTEALAAIPQPDTRLEQVRALLAHLESGDEQQASTALDELVRLRERQIFQEIGKLTRELHEALNAFRLDDRIATLANEEIPDAKERLNYVVRMTEEAASRTLARIEESRPLCEEMRRRSGTLATGWERFRRREMDVNEFRDLSRELSEFFVWTGDSVNRMHSGLSDVLMAQSFQDLTGQIIKRVITLVEEVEGNLVNLIRLSGQRLAPAGAAVSPAERLEGPQVRGKEQAGAVKSQDEVDDLLSSLGF
jgi:chemotaxis protein CheZ